LFPSTANYPVNVLEFKVSMFARLTEISDNRFVRPASNWRQDHLCVQSLFPPIKILCVTLGAFFGAHVLALIDFSPGGFFGGRFCLLSQYLTVEISGQKYQRNVTRSCITPVFYRYHILYANSHRLSKNFNEGHR
jgi:hypothetical protein